VFRRTDAGYFKIISTTAGSFDFSEYFRTDVNQDYRAGNYWQDLNPGVTTAGTFTIDPSVISMSPLPSINHFHLPFNITQHSAALGCWCNLLPSPGNC